MNGLLPCGMKGPHGAVLNSALTESGAQQGGAWWEKKARGKGWGYSVRAVGSYM